jgi:hypothetical protein
MSRIHNTGKYKNNLQGKMRNGTRKAKGILQKEYSRTSLTVENEMLPICAIPRKSTTDNTPPPNSW